MIASTDASAGASESPRAPRRVSELVEALGDAGLLVSVSENAPEFIVDLVDDSRVVTRGAAFIAVRGHAQDGHEWLEAATTAGASLAIVEDSARTTLPSVVVRDGRRAAAVVAAAFYGWPARNLTLIGVTGTNGKTTTVGLLRHLCDAPNESAASIGTLGVLVGSSGATMPGGSGLTTPGPVELQRVLRLLVDRGVHTVAMEVSSHSLDQRRVEGLAFQAAVFTNLTRDHLDYHGTMDAYRTAKLRLVGLLARDGVAVFNADDPAWRDAPSAPQTLTFGTDASANVSARELRFTPEGSSFLLVTPTGAIQVTLPLIGDFNVSNALGAAAAALSIGVPLADVAARLSSIPQVPGRLERIHASPTVLRDYAHTPDALERAIRAVRPFTRPQDATSNAATTNDATTNDATTDGVTATDGSSDGPSSRLIVMFGCGGDRDRGKRPEMGRIAEQLADVVIVTSDNPRTEDPERILDDIEAGMATREHVRIVDRRDAIAHALAEATSLDVILLAGKGHETYQIRGTTSYPFDERQIVEEIAAAMSHTQ